MMAYLVSAYSLIFGFLAAYFVWTGTRLRRLDREVAVIREMLTDIDHVASRSSPDGQ